MNYKSYPTKFIIALIFLLKPKDDNENDNEDIGLSYLIDENPPWYIAILLGVQVMSIYSTYLLELQCKQKYRNTNVT